MHELYSRMIRARTLLMVSSVLFLVGSATVQAANTCKGLSKSKCEHSSSCSWVSGYTTKSGNKVNPYCRAKGGKSSSKAGTKTKGKKERPSHSGAKSDSKQREAKGSAKKGSGAKKAEKR